MVLHTQQSSSEHWPTLLSGRINGAFYSYTRFYVSNIKKSHIISQNKCDTQLLIMAARKNSHICNSIKYIHWTQQVCAINTCVDDWCHEDSWVTTSAGIGYDREVTGRVLSTQIFFFWTIKMTWISYLFYIYVSQKSMCEPHLFCCLCGLSTLFLVPA